MQVQFLCDWFQNKSNKKCGYLPTPTNSRIEFQDLDKFLGFSAWTFSIAIKFFKQVPATINYDLLYFKWLIHIFTHSFRFYLERFSAVIYK